MFIVSSVQRCSKGKDDNGGNDAKVFEKKLTGNNKMRQSQKRREDFGADAVDSGRRSR